MTPFLSLGPLTLPSYPFLVIIGLWAGMWLAAKAAGRLKIDGDHVYNIGLYSLVGGLLGGRAWYVLSHWESYADVPLQAFSLTLNAVSLPEGAIIGLAIALIYSQKYRLSIPALADALAPGITLALAIGGLGAFLGSQTQGTPTALPWGVVQFGEVRHPAHLYLASAALLILAILWFGRPERRRPGFSFLLFVELYAGSRLLLDPFFAMPVTIGAGLRVVQVAALAVMVLTLAVMARVEKSA